MGIIFPFSKISSGSRRRLLLESLVRFLLFLPILAAFALLEVFIGGARLLYGVPAVALIALAGVLSGIPKFKTSRRADIPALAASLLFAAAILLRNRFSEVEYIARLQFFIMAGCLLVYLLFALVLTRSADRKRFFLFLGILALLQMIPALIQFSQGNQWMPLSWAQRTDTSWRASGFYISPNHFAGFLEIIALLAASFTIWGRATLITRVLTGYVALTCVVGVAVSGSRGSYLSLLFGMVILLILSLLAWRRMKGRHSSLTVVISLAAVLLLFGGILFLMFQSPTLGTRVMQINDPENMRLLLWRSALEQFHLSPVWGTGGFSFLYYGRLFRDPRVQNDPIHVHNDYLQLLADYGIIGMVLFLLFLALHLRAGIASFRRFSTASASRASSLKSDRLALTLGSLAAVAAYMIHSVVDFNMQLPLNAFTMASLFAVLASPGERSEERTGRQQANKFCAVVRCGIPIMALATIVYGVPMIRGEYLAERARVALRDGHPQEALIQACQGTAERQDNPELYFYRGEAAMELSIQENGHDSTLRDKLQEEAINAFASGMKVFPKDSRLALKLAQAQAVAKQYFPAMESVDLAESLDPNSSFVAAYRGMVESTFGNFDEAAVAFHQAINLGGEGAEIARKGLRLQEKAQKETELKQEQ
jgi:O-antigen ligase